MVSMEKLLILLNLFFSGDNADHGHLDEFGEYGKTGGLGDSREYGNSDDSGWFGDLGQCGDSHE